jgi:hypothetical protein
VRNLLRVNTLANVAVTGTASVWLVVASWDETSTEATTLLSVASMMNADAVMLGLGPSPSRLR